MIGDRLGGRARLLYVGPFITMFDRFSMAPILVPIAHDLGVSFAQVTVVATTYFVLYGAMQVVYGLLSDRVGRVRLMRVTCLGVVVAGLVSAAAPNLWVLAAGRALTGGLICCLLPTTLAYVGDLVCFRFRQRAVADVLGAAAIGIATAPLGAGLLAHHLSWRLTFLLPALAAGGLAVALAWVPESLPPGQAAGGPWDQLGRLARTPWVLFVASLGLVEGVTMLGGLTFLAPALEGRGVNPATTGLVVGSYGGSVIAGTRLVRMVAGRVPAHLLILGGGACLVLCFVAAAADQRVPGILAAAVLAGLAYSVMHSTLQTWATEVAPGGRGTATAAFAAATFLGAGAGTALMGGLAGSQQYARLFAIMAAVAVPAVLAAAAGRRRFGEAPTRDPELVSRYG